MYVHFISLVATGPIHHILLNMIMLKFGVAPHYAIIESSHYYLSILPPNIFSPCSCLG